MSKGFTLIEMIAAVVLFCFLTVFAIPNIINQISSKRNDISDATLNIIYQAADLYMNDNNIKETISINDNYCVSIDTLVSNGYLKENLKDYRTGNTIELNKYVKAKVNQYRDFTNFEITDESC